MLLEKVLPTFQTNRSKKAIKKLQNIFKEPNPILIGENKSLKCLLKGKINRATIKSQQKRLKQLKAENIANQEVLKMNQQIVKTDMRSCIQMAMTRIQKTLSDSYTSSSKETPDNTPKQDRSRINRKEKTEE